MATANEIPPRRKEPLLKEGHSKMGVNSATFPKKSEFSYMVFAVMFGADETLLNIQLRDGFSFVRKSLIPLKDHLDSVFETDAMGLRRDYETARISPQSLDVICAIKEVTIGLNNSDAPNFFHEENDKNLIALDNQIRAIRFLEECPLRCKKIAFKMDSAPKNINGTKFSNSFCEIFPVNESLGTIEITKLNCDKTISDRINRELPLISFPLTDEVLNMCHAYYDLSYHQGIHLSITLLITALEMIYLEKEDAKKEKLAKRCAVYLYDRRENRIDCYNSLRQIYKKRSNFVHEGIFDQIEDKDILLLRHYVRKSIFKALSNKADKKQRIANLKHEIANLDYWII